MILNKSKLSSISSFDIVSPFKGDPFIGNLATPISNSELTKSYLKDLPIYKSGTSPFLRGISIGFTHAYFLFGPFVSLGPLRTSTISGFIGLLATISLLLILTTCLSIYGYVSFPKSLNNEPSNQLKSSRGWKNFTSGFLIGGFGGSCFAYVLFQFFSLNTLIIF